MPAFKDLFIDIHIFELFGNIIFFFSLSIVKGESDELLNRISYVGWLAN